MPDLNNTSFNTFNNWELRVRESKDASPRLLLMIHGLTGDENSMWVFAQNLPAKYWIVAPRAPHPAEPTGYSWRPAPSETFGRPNYEQLLPAAEALIQLVDEYSASAGFDASTFDVMGFSQGAAMSNMLAFLYPERVRKVGILAGFVPTGLEEFVPKHPLNGKTIFVTHGTKDAMVPLDRARASMALLEQAGANVTYCEDEVGHKVSVTCLRSLRAYLED